MAHSRTLAVLALALATIGCDQATKQLARTHLAGRPTHSYLGGTVRIQYAENPGAFLSLGAAWPPALRLAVFTIGTAVLLSGLALMSVSRQRAPLQRAALVLLWAGGVSNLVDRIAAGRVIDFLNVGVGALRTGVFNVADMAVMGGLLLLVLEARLVREAGRRSGSGTPGPPAE